MSETGRAQTRKADRRIEVYEDDPAAAEREADKQKREGVERFLDAFDEDYRRLLEEEKLKNADYASRISGLR